MPRARILLAALLACAGLTLAAVAWAAETLTVDASFNPDHLGAQTNLSATARFGSTTGGVPSPVRHVTAYGPAGLGVDVRGAGACVAAKLEEEGPSACPANSRIGFGGGVGLLELAHEVIQEPFTLDFFLGPSENGHLVLLIYVNAVSPASVQLVLVAKEIHGPKPYGFGASFEIPAIPTLPEASNASVEKVFVSFGATKAAYYKKVHGRKTLFHVKGMTVPKTCPRGGFPVEGILDFADGTTITVNPTIRCPRK
jgi:hypothetical protein